MKIFCLLFALMSMTVSAQNHFDGFVKKLDVAYTCVPNPAPDDFRSAFLSKVCRAGHDMYKLKSKALYKNIYGQKSYLQYFLSYYLFNDTADCKQAVERFFSVERLDGLKYMVDGGVKTTPMVMIFNSKSIYCVYGACETELESWENLKKTFIAEYADDNATLLIAKCGFVKWEKYRKQ